MSGGKSFSEIQDEADRNKKYARLVNELDQAKADILQLKEKNLKSQHSNQKKPQVRFADKRPSSEANKF